MGDGYPILTNSKIMIGIVLNILYSHKTISIIYANNENLSPIISLLN